MNENVENTVVPEDAEKTAKSISGIGAAFKRIGAVLSQVAVYNPSATLLSDWIEYFETGETAEFIVIKHISRNNSKEIIYNGKQFEEALGKTYRDFMFYEDGKIGDGILTQYGDTLVFSIQTQDVDTQTADTTHPITYELIVSHWR